MFVFYAIVRYSLQTRTRTLEVKLILLTNLMVSRLAQGLEKRYPGYIGWWVAVRASLVKNEIYLGSRVAQVIVSTVIIYHCLKLIS